MRKFGDIYKEKVNEAEIRLENKVLEDFKAVYNAMLEHYGLNSVHQLDNDSQISFLTELNHYWSEENGLSEKGSNFLNKRSMSLNENATAVQKKNFLKAKTYAVINETFRQSELKYKVYDVIDEMYHQLKASNLNEVLTPSMITNVIKESLLKCSEEFLSGIDKELNESVEPKRKYVVKVSRKN